MQRRWVSLTLLALSAGVWCVTIGVLGLWLIGEQHRGVLSNPVVSICAGLACLCGAQLVFLECVADRVFPSPHGGIRTLIRGANALTLGGSVCVLMLSLVIIRV